MTNVLLILHHSAGLFLLLQLARSCGRVEQLRRAPKSAVESASGLRWLQGQQSWLITPLFALTLYLSFWLLDTDHQRLRSLWSLAALLLSLGALSLDLELRRQLITLSGGVGSEAGSRPLSRVSQALLSTALLLSLTYWGLQI